MHFDILVPNEGKELAAVLAFGRTYLADKNIPAQSLTASECRFCHIEAASPEVEREIAASGFSIIEMQHCN